MENILRISGRKSERERERLIRSKKDTFEDDERNIFNNIDFKMIEAKKRRRRREDSFASFFFFFSRITKIPSVHNSTPRFSKI